jgi:periplasmic mercuric ion binding protein
MQQRLPAHTDQRFAVSVLASSTALAAEKTITLAVKNMHCADCPFIVRKSLEPCLA